MNKPNESLEGPSQRRSWWSRNWFYTALITIAVIGAFCAFCVPLFIPEPFSAGDSVAALRQAILAATGGILAMLTLWENRRKNLQEKDKNDLDHTRQVKAERRSRYAKAIEQLADDKSTVRLGGVYSLVKLADEWLTDSRTLPSENDRKEEVQIIINSLCSYIRSPFPLVENKDSLTSNRNKESYNGDYNSDRAKLYGEQETRSTIIQEITNRLRNENKTIKNSKNSPRNGPWSDFSYNLSGAIFFYAIDFSSCAINGQVNFSDSTFEESAEFCNSVFNSDIISLKLYSKILQASSVLPSRVEQNLAALSLRDPHTSLTQSSKNLQILKEQNSTVMQTSEKQLLRIRRIFPMQYFRGIQRIPPFSTKLYLCKMLTTGLHISRDPFVSLIHILQKSRNS